MPPLGQRLEASGGSAAWATYTTRHGPLSRNSPVLRPELAIMTHLARYAPLWPRMTHLARYGPIWRIMTHLASLLSRYGPL